MGTLFFTSPIGLGHASRDVAIAVNLDSEATFVTGEGASAMISDHGFSVKDLYRHDGFVVDSNGELKNAFRWLLSYWSFYRRCREMARNLIEESRPRLVVADEDFAAISVAQEGNIPNVVITDLLQTKFTKNALFSFVERKMNRVMRDLIGKSSLVIIPDNGDDHDNFAYVGPIVRRVSATREKLRQEFGFVRKTILVTIGGTSAGLFLVRKAIEAYNAVKSKVDADMIVVTGPSTNISLAGVKHMGYVRNLHEMVCASDLLVSLAGRSTTDEAEIYGTPGIFIPIKNHFEQEENARRFGYSHEDIYRLQELMCEKLDVGRTEIKVSDGAQKAARLIESFLK